MAFRCQQGDHCLLCNKAVTGSGPLAPFRAVFTTPDQNWSVAHLSEKAAMHDWLAGIPGYPSKVSTQYCRCTRGNLNFVWTVAQTYDFFRRAKTGERSREVVWAFPFHEKCWRILGFASERMGIPIDIQALYDVAMSFQFEDWVRNRRFMRFNADGIVPHRHVHGQNVLLAALDGSMLQTYRNSLISVSALDTFVPYRRLGWMHSIEQHHIDQIEKRVHQQVRETIGHGIITAGFWNQTDKDIFARLPTEMRLFLFTFLEFGEMRKLRLASSACAAVAMTEAFFEPMFRPYGRFGHLYPLAMDYFSGFNTKWGKTVNCVLKIRQNKVLEEHEIIWKSSLVLLQLIKTRVESPICHGKDTYHRLAGRIGTYESPREYWKDEFPDDDPAPLEKRWIILPQPLGEVRASTMRFKERTYVTGLSFISKKGEKVDLGYIHPDSEVTIWTQALSGSQQLYTCTIATDSMGVRGIGAVTRYKTPWAGDFDETYMDVSRLALQRLNVTPGVTGFFLEASFDVRDPHPKTEYY